MSGVPIQVLLVENQSLTRIGVRSVIAEESDIELIGEAENAEDGFRLFG